MLTKEGEKKRKHISKKTLGNGEGREREERRLHLLLTERKNYLGCKIVG